MIWILIIVMVPLLYVASVFVPSFIAERGYLRKELGDFTVVGHRGGASIGPENTLLCIERGIEAGAEMIEIDIHLTKDGQLLVCHDQTVNRTTNGKGRIRDLTLAEIKRLNVVYKGKVTDEKLPTLDEVLDLVHGRCDLLIEIKRTGNIYQGIEEKMLQTVDAHHARGWVVVQSFNDSVLENTHRLDPSVRLEKLVVFKFPGLPYIFDLSFSRFSYEKYSYIESFNFFYGAVNRSLINDIHAHNREVKLWTLEERMKAPHWPVDGIITNRPDDWQP
ncbi:MAG: hypothetical protein K6F94_08505 [Bacteroidaceae bacterium]|nr:hypothetical protein [Bacteroidaceae bacterium]